MGGGVGGAQVAALKEENGVLKETVAGLERERDFYFSKLRDIELLIQQAIEGEPELEKEDGLLKQIQNILYSTEVCSSSYPKNPFLHFQSSFFVEVEWAGGMEVWD